jgi:hypothetical protein
MQHIIRPPSATSAGLIALVWSDLVSRIGRAMRDSKPVLLNPREHAGRNESVRVPGQLSSLQVTLGPTLLGLMISH